MKVAEKKAIAKEVEKLEKQNESMRSLATRKGFYECYFELLKTSKTKVQAFNKVNKLYFQLFGQKRYGSFLVFSERVKI